MNTLKISINMNDKPANKQWTPYSAGATNKNVNSIGSVIPVKAAVNAADANNDPTTFFLLGAACLYIAYAAAGKPNIMNGNLPVMNLVVPETILDIVSASAPTKLVMLDNWAKYPVLAPAIVSHAPFTSTSASTNEPNQNGV